MKAANWIEFLVWAPKLFDNILTNSFVRILLTILWQLQLQTFIHILAIIFFLVQLTFLLLVVSIFLCKLQLVLVNILSPFIAVCIFYLHQHFLAINLLLHLHFLSSPIIFLLWVVSIVFMKKLQLVWRNTLLRFLHFSSWRKKLTLTVFSQYFISKLE